MLQINTIWHISAVYSTSYKHVHRRPIVQECGVWQPADLPVSCLALQGSCSLCSQWRLKFTIHFSCHRVGEAKQDIKSPNGVVKNKYFCTSHIKMWNIDWFGFPPCQQHQHTQPCNTSIFVKSSLWQKYLLTVSDATCKWHTCHHPIFISQDDNKFN